MENPVKNCRTDLPPVTVADELKHIRTTRLDPVFRRLVDRTGNIALTRLASHLFEVVDAGLQGLEAIAEMAAVASEGKTDA